MLFDAARPTCSECRQTALGFGEYPKCSKCPLPAARASRKNAEAYAVFLRLSAARDWDGMSGTPKALRFSEVRSACSETEDPDAIRTRVEILDRMWMEEALRRAKKEARRANNRHKH